ncbi:MAG TPA: biotin--[acetyl-CoA-carboxylase] ligase [Bryobacteraceae bacterium]|nr:biotin--[acetyl-CoA-carboxylase] ligase [Bryobacteraceae bacterium]
MTPLDLSLLSRRVYYYRSIDSTMTAAAVLPLGSIVLAEEQTAGQGRHGHSWHSEPFAGIYCSIVLPPAPLLTLALGLATAEAIGIPCDLRWPNDVMIGNRKTAGILVNLVDGKAVAGIGINVNHTGLPTDLEATSLRLAAGHPFEREPILNALFDAVPAFTALPPEDILRLFTKASSYAAGRRVVVHQPDGVIRGTTAGLNPDGFLIVRKDDGTETLVLAGGVRAAGS